MDEAAARRLVARESPGLSVQGCRFDKGSVATENYVRVWEAWTTTHVIEGVLILIRSSGENSQNIMDEETVKSHCLKMLRCVNATCFRCLIVWVQENWPPSLVLR